ncbi:MAG: M13 family metallopeptidase [Cryomorphaceae bacterium]|nr:M13 family metallopeptidase [Cryomorphaceae bacterium]
MHLKQLIIPIFTITVLLGCESSQIEDVMDGSLGFDLSHIDSSYSPCEDFFMFASAGWMRDNPIPASEARWGSFPILVEENNKKIRGLLEGLRDEDLEQGTYRQQLRDFYKSAMDSAVIENNDLDGIKEELNAIVSWKNKEDMAKYLQTAAGSQLPKPFGMYVSADSKNSEQYALYISQGGLGLPDRDYYFKDDKAAEKIREAYLIHLTEVFSLLDKDNASELADDVFALEKKMAAHHMSRRDARKPELTYNKLPANALSELTPFVDWSAMFNDLELDPDSVIVRQIAFMEGLNDVLKDEPLTIWQSYFTWHLIHQFAEYLPTAFVESSFDFYGKVLQGVSEMKPRWKRSISKINSGFSEPLGRLFADEYFSHESRARVEKMVEDIRAVYNERIDNNEWMSAETKVKAKEKLNAFRYKIGYPDNWTDFSTVEIVSDDLLGNHRRLSAHIFKDKIGRLGKPVDKTEWFMGAHIVNAYYSPSFNEIVFPAGILQPPFFDPKADDAVNYGAIGGVIGHEFTHGFDDQGRKYNAFGNLTNWWSEEDSLRFAERTRKVVDFYGGMEPVDGYFVDGELTLGENIADIGGLTLAYHAYKKHIAVTGGRTIKGFTPSQRVFMGWANVWRSHATEEYIRQQVVTDPHSPAQYRVNATMSMIPEFQEAFGCEQDDPLVITEEERAMIW